MAISFSPTTFTVDQGDYTGHGDSLLDYTPPDINWQSPTPPLGGNVFANYVQSYPDLTQAYNRRLSRPSGSAGSLPLDPTGMPQSMSNWGLQHWSDHGEEAGRELPFRNPFLSYSGNVPGERTTVNAVSGLPQPDVAGMTYAYPVQYFSEPYGGGDYRYAPTGQSMSRYPGYSAAIRPSFTTDIDMFPYFPYQIGDPTDLMEDTEGDQMLRILMGQTLIPTDKVGSGIFTL
tara:strand:- start:376 stop:1068 length:693 start_codon:yes stop_codon:yes gene_type:complete